MSATAEENTTPDDATIDAPAAPPSRREAKDKVPSEKHRIAINAATNAGVMVAKVAIIFFVSPFLVHGLGDTRYGIWMFVSSITAYLALGDFGVKSAVTWLVARNDGLNDREGINRVMNTSLAVLSGVGLLVAGITFVAARFWHSPASIPAEFVAETRSFFVLSGLLIAALLPVSVPSALLAGLGAFPTRNAVALVSLVVRNILLVGAVWYGGSLVAIGAVLLAMCPIDYAMMYVAARRCFPQIACSRRYLDSGTLRTICGYGVHVFAGDIAYLVIGQSSAFIIGLILASADSITYYSLGASLKDHAISVLAMLVLVVTPAVSKWQATQNNAAIRTVLTHALRYALYFTAPIEFGLLFLGYPFLTLWMGRRYADNGYTTLVILAAPLVLAAVGLVAARVLQGIGQVRPLAIVTVLQAVLTVVFSVVLARPYGIEGVAWGVSLALTLCSPAIVILLCRYVGMHAAGLLVRASWGPLLASAPAVLTWIAAKHWLSIGTWFAFVAVGVCGMAFYSVVLLLLEPDVRHMALAAARRLPGLVALASRTSARAPGAEEA